MYIYVSDTYTHVYIERECCLHQKRAKNTNPGTIMVGSSPSAGFQRFEVLNLNSASPNVSRMDLMVRSWMAGCRMLFLVEETGGLWKWQLENILLPWFDVLTMFFKKLSTVGRTCSWLDARQDILAHVSMFPTPHSLWPDRTCAKKLTMEKVHWHVRWFIRLISCGECFQKGRLKLFNNAEGSVFFRIWVVHQKALLVAATSD